MFWLLCLVTKQKDPDTQQHSLLFQVTSSSVARRIFYFLKNFCRLFWIILWNKMYTLVIYIIFDSKKWKSSGKEIFLKRIDSLHLNNFKSQLLAANLVNIPTNSYWPTWLHSLLLMLSLQTTCCSRNNTGQHFQTCLKVIPFPLIPMLVDKNLPPALRFLIIWL